ncbi:hypothetical protein GNI_071300 [Gregarina niphandrodes]|uniref:Uncharacterized protein n=1 Tax=Gregarina niphandrodes TaxID=110365 RepID=A0A023B794_GRENI|nr:hypothetical protein GNI_071300 [Gregarina niphandrodes]EZG67146.1 hypothetical protein GNI_071300 [Gregarina niphandrodes]|eukprot:XP_011130326.1 hypothetical protein GNI_071300 [Gregarina niphandrodes]
MKCLAGGRVDISVGVAELAHVVWPVSFNGRWLDVTELAHEEFAQYWDAICPPNVHEMDALMGALKILHDLPDTRVWPGQVVADSKNGANMSHLGRLQRAAALKLYTNSRARGALLVSIAGFLKGVGDIDDPEVVSWQMQKTIRDWWNAHGHIVAFVSLDPTGLRCALPTFPAFPNLNALATQFDSVVEAKLGQSVVMVPVTSLAPPRFTAQTVPREIVIEIERIRNERIKTRDLKSRKQLECSRSEAEIDTDSQEQENIYSKELEDIYLSKQDDGTFLETYRPPCSSPSTQGASQPDSPTDVRYLDGLMGTARK